jgi:hypothetical protein
MTTTERAKVFDFILDGDDGDAILRRSKPIEEFLSLRIQGEDVSGTLSPEERAANLPQFGTGMTLKGCHNITLARVLLKFLADTAKLKYKSSKNTTGVCIFSLSLSLSLSLSPFLYFFIFFSWCLHTNTMSQGGKHRFVLDAQEHTDNYFVWVTFLEQREVRQETKGHCQAAC